MKQKQANSERWIAIPSLDGSARGDGRSHIREVSCLARGSRVSLSKIQIALYLALGVGIFTGLAHGLPHWQLLALAAVVCIADYVSSGREPLREAPAEWPWQRPGFWIVLALLAALAIALAYIGAPVGINVLICGIGVIFYGFHLAGQVACRRRQLSGRPWRTSSKQNWALLICSLAFCAGALLNARHDWRAALVTITFFGACALIFVADILRKRRERRERGSIVQVTGGVNIPVESSRVGFIALGCCVVGAVLFFVGVNYPLLLRLLGAFIGLVGVALAIALACGYFRRQFIRFDPDAFTVGERGFRYRLEWDNFDDIAEIEFASNPFVGIRVRSVEAIVVEPPDRAPSFRSLIANNRALMDADVVIAPRNFGIDGPVLAGALARYANDDDARAELATRR